MIKSQPFLTEGLSYRLNSAIQLYYLKKCKWSNCFIFYLVLLQCVLNIYVVPATVKIILKQLQNKC